MPAALDPDTGQRITDEKLAFDPAKMAKGLEDAENYANDPENATESLDDKEKSGAGFVDKTTKSGGSKDGGGRFRMGKLKGSSKKPMGVIGLLLVGGMSITLLFGAPAMIFATAAAVLTNAKNNAAPASNHRGMLYMSKRLVASVDAVKNGACQVIGVRCKSSTMSDKQVAKLEKAGIKVTSTPLDAVSGRQVVTSIDVPDGTVKTDGTPNYLRFQGGEDINKKLKRNPAVRSALHKGYNPLTASFFDAKFKLMLQDGFKTHKGDKLKGTTEKELRQSARAGMGAGDAPGDANGRSTPEEKEKARADAKSAVGAGKVINAAGLACGAYTTARAVVAAGKAYQILKLGAIFMFYASEAQRVVAGNSDPEKSAFIGENLNYSESNELDSKGEPNRFYNSSFFDAEGMQMILHGDVIGLKWFTEKYIVGGSATIGAINVGMKAIEDAADGKQNLKLACRIANSGAICLASGIAAFFTGGAAVPATIVAAKCALIIGAMATIMGLASQYINEGIQFLGEQAADMDLDDDTKGIDLGNAVAAGAGLIMGRMAQERGLRPSKVGTQKQYLAATTEIRQEIADVERYEARKTPFNVANQYSFMGTIAKSIYSSGGYSPSIMGNVGRLFGILPASVQTLTTAGSANAAWVMKDNEFQDGWYVKPNGENVCPDPAVGEEGANINPDAFCTPVFDMSPAALNMDIAKNEDFMIDGGYADEITGEPMGEISGISNSVGSVVDSLLGGLISYISDDADNDPGHKFAMYKEYCANRDHKKHGGYGDDLQGPEMGTDTDDKWRKGFYCSNTDPGATSSHKQRNGGEGSDSPSQEELDNFAAFTMDSGDGGTGKTMDEEGFDIADTTDTATNGPYSKNTGPWVIPTSGPCLSPFGPRGGENHAGIDISPPQGTPIVAPTSMEITFAGMNSGGYGYMVTGTATDDSGNSFRFGHMMEQPPVTVGQKVSKGDVIGKVGSTGQSTGPHLHFEIFPPGADPASFSGAVDPVPILGQHQVSISCGG